MCTQRQKQRGERIVCSLFQRQCARQFTVHGFPQVCRLGTDAFLRLHKSTESPRGPMCQFQEGHCVQASLSIVVCVCLAWPLNQERPAAERGEAILSVYSVSHRSVSLSAASQGASAGTDKEYQSAWCYQLYNTSIFLFLNAIILTHYISTT